MRRVQVVRRATSRPLPVDETAESTAIRPWSDSALSRRRARRDAEVAETLTRIDEATAA